MLVYRIQKAKHSQSREDILSGMGAYKAGGRWNKRGTPLIYTCENPATAVLEILVHLETTSPDDVPNLVIVIMDIPDESIFKVDAETLPKDWNKIIHPPETQTFTQTWLKEVKFLAMEIPSAVMELSKNYLINPLHPDIQKVNIIKIQDYVIDSRLLMKDEPKIMTDIFKDIIGFENQ